MAKGISSLLAKVKAFPAGLDRIIAEELKAAKADDAVREQMKKGIDSEGNPFGQYAQLTKGIRQAAGKQTAFIDLDFTGKFKKSVKQKVKRTTLSLGATDPKWHREIKPDPRFKDAIGLTRRSKKTLTEKLFDRIRPRMKKLL